MYNYYYKQSYNERGRGCNPVVKEHTEDDYHPESGVNRHTHEFTGSVRIAAPQTSLLHNHRFAGVTDEAIELPGGGHTHRFECRTDFAKGHYHIMTGTTEPSVQVGDGKHVHYAAGRSSQVISHQHGFQFASLIDGPTDMENMAD